MISFVVLGAQVLMTLFIGIVATSMEEAKAAGKEDAKHDIRLKQRQRALGIDNESLDLYAAVFKELDGKNEKKLGREAIKPLVRSLPLLRNAEAMVR
jgi:DNA/RNA-binding domain of Phe-tRNA-synthetase-like protein